MNKVKNFLFSLIFFPLALVASPPFTLITVPKSGSHLAIKALYFLTRTPTVWHTHFPSVWCIPADKGFLYTHFCLSKELEDNYNCLPDLKK